MSSVNADGLGEPQALARLDECAPELAALLRRSPARLRSAAGRVLDGSDFVAAALLRDARLLPLLLERTPQDFAAALPLSAFLPGDAALAGATDEAQFMSGLRRWRHAELTRIAWRDLAGWASLAETLNDLSNAADVALRSAHDFAWRVLAERHGAPAPVGGRRCDRGRHLYGFPQARHRGLVAFGGGLDQHRIGGAPA